MLFGTVTRQLDAGGVVVRTGPLVDVTLLPSASIQHDAEARWVGHKPRKPVQGHKAHVATGREAVLIHKVEITTAHVHDAVVRKVRCRIEKVFGTCKRSCGLRRMRWLSLARAGLRLRLSAIAHDLGRSWRSCPATWGRSGVPG